MIINFKSLKQKKLPKLPFGYFLLAFFLKLWLGFGVAMIVSDIALLSGAKWPTYENLSCETGRLEKYGRKKWMKVGTNYIDIEVQSSDKKRFVSGYFNDDLSPLKGFLGQNITVCFHQYSINLTKFNLFAEVIYDNKRLINQYEKRREKDIRQNERRGKNLWFSILFWILIPLTSVIFIYKKKGF